MSLKFFSVNTYKNSLLDTRKVYTSNYSRLCTDADTLVTGCRSVSCKGSGKFLGSTGSGPTGVEEDSDIDSIVKDLT